MKLEVVVPEEFMGDINGHISSKRGHVEGMEDKGMMKAIRAKVPLAELFGYVTTLRSMTQGRGSANIEFDRYEIVPMNVAEDIINDRK